MNTVREVKLKRAATGFQGFMDGMSSWWSSTRPATSTASRTEPPESAPTATAHGGLGSERCGVGLGIAVDGARATRVTEVTIRDANVMPPAPE